MLFTRLTPIMGCTDESMVDRINNSSISIARLLTTSPIVRYLSRANFQPDHIAQRPGRLLVCVCVVVCVCVCVGVFVCVCVVCVCVSSCCLCVCSVCTALPPYCVFSTKMQHDFNCSMVFTNKHDQSVHWSQFDWALHQHAWGL